MVKSPKTAIHKSIIGMIFLAIVLILSVNIWKPPPWSTEGKNNSSLTPYHSTSGMSVPGPSTREKGPRDSIRLSVRAQHLANLKKQWLELGVSPSGAGEIRDDIAKRRELSSESARLLLCSKEVIDLIQFLEREDILNSVEVEVRALFDSELDVEAREMLISLPDKLYDGVAYRSNWSWQAGEFCPPEYFDNFCNALNSASCKQQAVFGRNKTLVKTDPISAVTSTLREIENGVDSPMKSGSLRTLLVNLPPDTEFEEIEKLLPAPNSGDPFSPYNNCLPALFKSWGKVDPAAVVNYIIDSPGKFSPMYIEHPAQQVLRNDLVTGIEWIQTFPDGPHFDAAARIAVDMLRDRGYLKEALELASQIKNPAFREAMIKNVAIPRPNH